MIDLPSGFRCAGKVGGQKMLQMSRYLLAARFEGVHYTHQSYHGLKKKSND